MPYELGIVRVPISAERDALIRHYLNVARLALTAALTPLAPIPAVAVPMDGTADAALRASLAIATESRRPDQSDSACTARELTRRQLTVEQDAKVYVEPAVFVVSGDKVLLAGKPSYLFAASPGAATFDVVSRYVVFGAVIDRDGSAQTVPAPDVNAGKVAAIAGSAVEDGSWRVIFAELDSSATDGEQTVSSFWHGIYDGARWSSLERLPDLPGKQLLYFNSSRIAESGDTIVWAARFITSPGNHGVVVYQRVPAGWSARLVGPSRVSYVQLAFSSTLGFTLALVYPDPSLNHDVNSLFLYRRRADWELVRKVVPGLEGAVHRPSLLLRGDSGVVTWRTYVSDQAGARIELRGMIGEIGKRNEPLLVVDDRSAEGRATLAGSAGILWVTDHLTRPDDARELQLRRPAADSTAIIWRTPYPYRGPLAAALYSESDVLIVGPQLDEGRELLVSLIVRVRLDCRQNMKAGR